MNATALILLALGAVSLVVLVGQHVWRLPRWLPPVLIFTGFGGVLAGMGVFALALVVG
ncbi:hypothetical protein [Roseospira goensis]|uniref:Uncharacterized membrane-anchored protein YitT (DUF2179 family) n=1 Tax=Roseospira goensis TaxID=391922 RepID=A0A7W6S0L4_9PROT|nr:hypothetical protein [Roseospira goensis]MBB4286701.1 uncharacterized membrane-anchored protein YitT (DUF2179 family) [Roseospira goensis]